MRKTLLAAVAIAAGSLQLWAQAENTSDYVFSSLVKTVKVAPAGSPYSPAMIALGGEQQLNVNFDLLDYDVHYLRYSVTHCDAQWRPSQLVESEWVSGFNQADVTDYAQSSGTFQHYYNYNFALPNDEMQLLLGGNYLLKVWDQDNPDEILFQSRFMVVDPKVNLSLTVSSRTDVDYNDRHQQLGVQVSYKNGTILDPFSELKTVVMQNSRPETAVMLGRPLYANSTSVTYDHDPGLIFKAGNEYRRMETVSITSMNMGVASIEFFEPYYHATLATDVERASQSYLYDQTQFGHFTVRNMDADDSDTEADYLVTHFSLFTGEKLQGGNMAIQGEFTKGMPAGVAPMHYDENSGCYQASLLLKQGAYNYQYLWYPSGSLVGYASVAEGDKFETVNEYTALVYDRPMGARYDNLVGAAVIFSGR